MIVNSTKVAKCRDEASTRFGFISQFKEIVSFVLTDYSQAVLLYVNVSFLFVGHRCFVPFSTYSV